MIPKGTESETFYQITWDDLYAAAVLMCSYTHCSKTRCECCNTGMEVLSEDNIKNYIRSKKFQGGKLPVETAMCDNFKGCDDFFNNALGIHFNVFSWNRYDALFYLIMP